MVCTLSTKIPKKGETIRWGRGGERLILAGFAVK